MEKDYFLQRLAKRQFSTFQKHNYDFIPDKFLATDKIPIECKSHGIFYQKAAAHLFSSDCPKCWQKRRGDARAHSTENFIKNSISKFGDKFNYSKTEYNRKNIEVIITCSQHGDVLVKPEIHLISKYGCPKCDAVIPLEERKYKIFEKIQNVHGNKYDYSKVTFKNVNDKTEIICPTHGSFWTRLYSHAHSRIGCLKCSRDSDKLSNDDFISRSLIIHDNKYDYSKVKYGTSETKVIITCLKHGDFIQKASSHLQGNGCEKCFREKYTLSTEKFIESAKKIHGSKYDYSKVKYYSNKRPVEIICPTHGSFWQKPNTHVSCRNGCKLCNESKGERAVEVFLNKYNIDFIREYKIKPYLYRYDFFLPEFNIFIEFNGQQHYWPIDFFGGNEYYQETKERDNIKKQLVYGNKGHLIVLTYLNLSNDSVEKELIKRLKLIKKYWFRINDKISAFKTAMDVFRGLNIPMSIQCKDLETVAEKNIPNLEVLFKS